MYGPLAGSLAGGILGQYKRENPGDKNQALQMAIRGGISGLTSNLAQGQNLLTGRGLSGPDAFRSPFEIGREQLAKFGIGDQQTANVNVPDSNFQNASFTNEADAIAGYDRMNQGFDSIGGDFKVMNASMNAPTGVATDAVGTVVKELPKEGFLESFGMEGSRAGLNPFNILKNPTPNQIKEMANYQRLIQGGTDPSTALSTIQQMFQLTPAKASAIAGAVTYGAQIIADRMSGDDDDDDQSSAGYEINPILEGIFTGAPTGELYYDYPSAIQAAEGGIMDLQDGGESVGPGTGTSDSIPAMLSDGEFVMTAKAVRGAGGGDRREGARKMYQMMDNLERSA
jgi:hypothetical protein